ncbi:MAG TPA: hypothetical protein VFD30_00800 [Terriglobia bacterium]|nr:hypothetical protein [Terriglobia bacterium]
MSTQLIALIQKANQDFGAFLDEFSGSSLKSHGTAGVSKRLATFAAEIAQVGDMLQEHPLPAQLDPDSEAEVARYVTNLEQLKGALEQVRRALVQRQEQLKTGQANILAASAWIESYKKTT